ncbi:uncharacterized protein LOC123443730 [Hordeum vulgare subsp. vulgare]|uniref:uncharacterized protein LOC123443730 n=1 Tax=Hordeum vulgare subsp. vulgare TaxID=112509 RepID=UPI00162EDE89|nr:uncharacterized protein LOC123443730 [Hordeum vulgare subsp. vulgare]
MCNYTDESKNAQRFSKRDLIDKAINKLTKTFFSHSKEKYSTTRLTLIPGKMFPRVLPLLQAVGKKRLLNRLQERNLRITPRLVKPAMSSEINTPLNQNAKPGVAPERCPSA